MVRTKKTRTGIPPTLPPGAPRISLAAPADAPIARFEDAHAVAVIGSRRDCNLFINQDGVSKAHCALVNKGHAIIVAHLGSPSGTFVNGHSISVAEFRPGDKLRVGPVPVDVRFDALASPDIQQQNEKPLSLRLIGGEQGCELTTLPAVVGRRRTCHVVIDTPDVSLAHALLFTIQGWPVISDLGSRSGTYVNGKRVVLCWLCDKDRLSIGGEELLVGWDGPQFAACTLASGKSRTLDLIERRAVRRGEPGVSAANRPAAEPEDSHARRVSSRAELERRLANCEATERRLSAREVSLEKREAALAAAEQGLAQREAANADAMREIEQFRDVLGEARRLLISANGAEGLSAVLAALSAMPVNAPSAAGAKITPTTQTTSTSDELPAPLVDRPLFSALDPKSPEQWPQEARERLKQLRRMSGKGEAGVMSQVLAEFRAKGADKRAVPGN